MTRPLEFGDWSRFERTLVDTMTAWRRRCAELNAIAAPLDTERDLAARALSQCPIPEALIHDEVRHALREGKHDPVAAALVPWAETFALEHALYAARFESAVGWGTPRDVRGRAEPTSMRALRRELLGGKHPAIRARAADDFTSWASVVGEPARRMLELRLERESAIPASCRALAVAEWCGKGTASLADAVTLAERWLAATDAIARELRRDDWQETLHLALASDARVGWPVRPSMRWFKAVLAREDWSKGLALGPVKVPSALGATSYARALGSFGMRVFEACRPATMPVAVHQHPQSLRKHERRALYASIVAEPTFAMRVLGLGKGPARDHQRAVATGFLVSARIDAWRVLVMSAAREGMARARERQAELAERVLGGGPGGELLAVFPTVRPGDGAALAGLFAASEARRHLIERHDEDWFQNPRALLELREEDARVEPLEGRPADAFDAAADALAREFEATLG